MFFRHLLLLSAFIGLLFLTPAWGQNKSSYFIMDPKNASGPICKTPDDPPYTKGTITIGGLPIAGKGVPAGKIVAIAGIGHDVKRQLYFQIYQQPMGPNLGALPMGGAYGGWVPVYALICQGTIPKSQMIPKK